MRLDHVGIAVRDLEAASRLWSEVLGLSASRVEVVDEMQVRVRKFETANTVVELLESTDPEGVIGRYVERRGEGIHHLCFETADFDGALAGLCAGGLTIARQGTGSGGRRVAFLHPKQTHGVLIELVESSADQGP